MNEELKVCFVFVAFFLCFGIFAYFLDSFIQRESRRTFYRDLVRLVLLYENSDLVECSIQVPKILGPRIVRFATYEAIINDLSNAYEAGLTNYPCLLAYVFSLHKSYCFSYHDLIKFKKKLYKEKQKNETHQNDNNN